MPTEDYPNKIYVTLGDEAEADVLLYLNATRTIEDAVWGSAEPVEVAEYVLNRKLRAKSIAQEIPEDCA